jgi:hypothetical protein
VVCGLTVVECCLARRRWTRRRHSDNSTVQVNACDALRSMSFKDRNLNATFSPIMRTLSVRGVPRQAPARGGCHALRRRCLRACSA